MRFELLKNKEGLQVFGATEDFRAFHGLVHDINERSPLVEDKEGLFLALAYDFRKAFEGSRIVEKPRGRDWTESRLVGFEILWPTLLIQCRMLRESLGFIDHSKRHQVLAYSLEAIVEEALPLDFKSRHEEITSAYRHLSATHPFLESKASSRIEHWYRWTKKQREMRLVQLLESLDPMFEADYRYRIKNGETELMSPTQWDAIELDEGDSNRTRH